MGATWFRRGLRNRRGMSRRNDLVKNVTKLIVANILRNSRAKVKTANGKLPSFATRVANGAYPAELAAAAA